MYCSYRRKSLSTRAYQTKPKLCSLMREAGINAKQAGEKGISAKNIKKVTEVPDDSSVVPIHIIAYACADVIEQVQRLSESVWCYNYEE